MKKLLVILVAFAILMVGVFYYFLKGADELIRTQIETQGSKFLGTPVEVAKVELTLTEGRLTISGISVANPAGFSDANAFTLEEITLDLGNVTSEPYTVQTVSIDAPEVLYELTEQGQANLMVLKEKLTANLPATESAPEPDKTTSNPLVMVENVTVSNVNLQLDISQLPTEVTDLGDDTYKVSLPTFSANAIGKPNGMPADQVGGAILDAMLSNVIKQAKAEAQKRIKDMAKDKVKEKLDEEKGKLENKAKDKLKDIFGG